MAAGPSSLSLPCGQSVAPTNMAANLCGCTVASSNMADRCGHSPVTLRSAFREVIGPVEHLTMECPRGSFFHVTKSNPVSITPTPLQEPTWYSPH
ncbi:hypothetical protein FKM82_026891 [Ascaphus truei]